MWEIRKFRSTKKHTSAILPSLYWMLAWVSCSFLLQLASLTPLHNNGCSPQCHQFHFAAFFSVQSGLDFQQYFIFIFLILMYRTVMPTENNYTISIQRINLCGFSCALSLGYVSLSSVFFFFSFCFFFNVNLSVHALSFYCFSLSLFSVLFLFPFPFFVVVVSCSHIDSILHFFSTPM